MSYGTCPTCGAKGIRRERRPDGNDMCENNHIYPSASAIPEKKIERAGAIEVTEEQVNKIINKTMSSEEWKADVSRFPKEWQTQVESVMAKALGHGIFAGRAIYTTAVQ